MAQNFDSSSTQGTIMVNIDEQEGNYGSNAQGEMPGNGGERGDMKGGPGNRQPDADMEKPQGSTPPDAPSGNK